jgi:hypothetical protein
VEGEDWAEERVQEFVGVPLKPVPAPGESAVPGTLTGRNFPHDFRQAAVYHALSRLLASEYFENEPNASESASWADEKANEHIALFAERRTTRVGAGRLRHSNPHMPPNIAPRRDQFPGVPNG